MAEQVQRFRQYEYRANSNLVLTSETHRPRINKCDSVADREQKAAGNYFFLEG